MLGNEKTAETCIQVTNLGKTFAQDEQNLQVLDDISFEVKKSEIVVIVGASGCGKSTLLRSIAGLDTAYSGKILVNGREVTGVNKERGMVFQEHRLFPWMTVAQNIGYALTGVAKAEKRERVQKCVNLVHLQGFEKSLPKQLSGGMAQRAGIARALVNNPPVLLLDEPFGALDSFTKISMQKELKRIQREEGTTMVLVTHDIEEAVFLADKVIVLSSRPGKIKSVVEVDLPEPRNRNSIEFLHIRKEIYNQFFEDETVQEEYNI